MAKVKVTAGIVFEDGTYNITANGDAVQAESSLTVNGGNFDIITEGTTTGTSDSQERAQMRNTP